MEGDTTETLIYANTLRPTKSSEDKLFKLFKQAQRYFFPLLGGSSSISFTEQCHSSQLILKQLAHAEQCFEV